MHPMKLRVGCRFEYESPAATPSVWQVRPRADGPYRVIAETWDRPNPSRAYQDVYGNLCDRLNLPPGPSTVSYDATVEVPSHADEVDLSAPQVPIEALPDEALVYLLPSRFCWPELLVNDAWALFEHAAPGWERVQAAVDWVHENIQYRVGTTGPYTTAQDVWESRAGVCRDFTHLGMTLCRSLNVPARYVAGYLPDIGVAPPDLPMDFCSWFEAWLGDRWWTFDPRNNEPRVGRVVIARGRDALDVAMVTTYGAPELKTMTVWADEEGP
jgi:transglutaminase-like putative cysteine protease